MAAPRNRRVTPERWKQIEAVFEQALEMPPEARAAFLQQNCDGDTELRREVESLLQSHAGAGEFLDHRTQFFSRERFEDAAGALAAGELIGAYRIIREIGRGGMGAVYLAERADEQYRKRVAIKLIKRGMDTDAVLRHFRNERQILASFDHPNIARLFDGGTTNDGLPYFVMEYVEGIAIDKYAEQHDLSIAERLRLFREVSSAVSYAHRHAVIHRDLKPSNILITDEGIPKLLDFGISKLLQSEDGAEAFVTAIGLRAMTPEFASPEQVRGEPVTTASDVYSLGVVLFELLTGCSPYPVDRKTTQDMTRAVTDGPARKPSTAISPHNRKFLRGDLDNIILMALRKEPARRYQSVEEFSEDIRRHLEALPVRARRDTFGYRAAKFARRHKTITIAAALVLLALVGGLIATTWQARRAERRFNQVRQLAHSVLFDYHDLIKDLPGATKARERLVRDALTYLDSLAGEAAGDQALQRELAAAYERVGDVRGQAMNANLGDRAGALESYEKAIRIREALVASTPQDAAARRDLAATFRKIGNLLLETADAGRGFDYLRKALALYSELANKSASDPVLRSELADIYNDVGSSLEDRGDITGALEHHRQARALREAILAANPADAKARRDLSVSYVSLGRALYLSGDFAGAIEINGKALALRTALAAEDPTNIDYRRLLAIAWQNDGDYRDRIGDTGQALESFRRKIALDKQSLASDPANARSRADYSYSTGRIADLLAALGDHAQALEYYKEYRQIEEAQVAADPGAVAKRYGLIMARGGIGRTLARMDELDGAREEAHQVAALLDATPNDRANAFFSSLRAQAFQRLGEINQAIASSSKNAVPDALESRHSAREAYQHALEIWQDLKSRGLLTADESDKPQKLTRAIAECEKSS